MDKNVIDHMKIGVSICIFCYNYEKYLAEAVDSVLSQITDFDIEIIIGDDFSTDNSRVIAKSYFSNYPDKIKLSFNDSNKGGTYNWINTINQCNGKYIALLDGDDYFIDPYKLQKQFDAMEGDQNAMLCFHAINEIFDENPEKNKVIRFNKTIFTLQDFLTKGWFIRTGSTFFRNGVLPVSPPEWVYSFPYRYDTIMHIFLGLKGHAIYLDEVMSVWRKHDKGMSKTLLSNTIANIQKEIALAIRLNNFTDRKYSQQVKLYCSKQYANLFNYLVKRLFFMKYPKLFVKSFLKMDMKYYFLERCKWLQKKLVGIK